MKKILILILISLHLLFSYAKGKRALLIGISEYPEIYTPGMSWDDIHGANDVDLLMNTLKKQGFTITACKNSNATAVNIRKEFGKLIKNSQKGDLVVIHFSGHGQPYEDFSNDEEDGWDESIVPYDAAKKYVKGKYEGKNHIIDDELHDFFNSLRRKVGNTGFVYVILDACYAGNASRDGLDILQQNKTDTIPVRGTNIGFTPSCKDYSGFKIDKHKMFTLKRQKDMSDICILEACRSYQTTQEIRVDGTYYGSLSYCVNKVLSNSPLTSDIKWVDLVGKEMTKQKRQTMVIETSVKKK